MNYTVEELAGLYQQGWVDRNPDRIAALHTVDSVFHMHGMNDPVAGRDQVRDFIVTLFKLVPDLSFETKRVYLGVGHIVLEYDMSGTFEQSNFVCDGVDVFLVADGLIARKDTYLDLVSLAHQVGDLPVFGSTA